MWVNAGSKTHRVCSRQVRCEACAESREFAVHGMVQLDRIYCIFYLLFTLFLKKNVAGHF